MTPYYKWAFDMLELIPWIDKELYKKLFLEIPRKRYTKYETREEAYEARKKSAREYYWRKKWWTMEVIQEKINLKRKQLWN